MLFNLKSLMWLGVACTTSLIATLPIIILSSGDDSWGWLALELLVAAIIMLIAWIFRFIVVQYTDKKAFRVPAFFAKTHELIGDSNGTMVELASQNVALIGFFSVAVWAFVLGIMWLIDVAGMLPGPGVFTTETTWGIVIRVICYVCAGVSTVISLITDKFNKTNSLLYAISITPIIVVLMHPQRHWGMAMIDAGVMLVILILYRLRTWRRTVALKVGTYVPPDNAEYCVSAHHTVFGYGTICVIGVWYIICCIELVMTAVDHPFSGTASGEVFKKFKKIKNLKNLKVFIFFIKKT